MKALEVRVPHTLEREEVRRRIDAALVRAREDYADKVGDIEASWDGADRLRLLLTVMGMRIAGDIEILVGELVVKLEIPGMAALFAGQIRDGIQQRLGGLLGSQQV